MDAINNAYNEYLVAQDKVKEAQYAVIAEYNKLVSLPADTKFMCEFAGRDGVWIMAKGGKISDDIVHNTSSICLRYSYPLEQSALYTEVSPNGFFTCRELFQAIARRYRSFVFGHDDKSPQIWGPAKIGSICIRGVYYNHDQLVHEVVLCPLTMDFFEDE